MGIDCLKEASKKTHDNRGASAGVIDLKKMPIMQMMHLN